MPGSKLSISSQIEHWLICHERFVEDMEHLENLLVFKYEDLVVSPQKVIGDIYNFLDLKDVPVSREIHPNINGKYFDKWEKMNASFLTKAYSSGIIETFEKRVNGFGYSLKDLDHISSNNFTKPPIVKYSGI